MAGRPHVLITREGWYYLFVVLFIVGGSVLREVNLLVILAGMMIAPLLFNWRVVVRGLRRTAVRRTAPRRCEAGQPIRIRVEVSNETRRDTAWMLTVVDSVRRARTRKRHFIESWIPHLPPQTSDAVTYRLVLAERGRYRLGPLRVQTRFPFGLMRSTVIHPTVDPLVVWPRIGQLTPQWRAMLHGERTGVQHSRSRRGQDGEFYALRPFVMGDSLRMVHWRSTAKVGEPMVRQTEHLELPEVTLVVDPYCPAASNPNDSARLERLLRMAATVVLDLCRESGRHITVSLVGGKTGMWRAAPTRRLAEQILDEFAEATPHNGSPTTAIIDAIQHSPGATPIVISTRHESDVDLSELMESPSRVLDTFHWLQIDDAAESLYIDALPEPPHKSLMRAVRRKSSHRSKAPVGSNEVATTRGAQPPADSAAKPADSAAKRAGEEKTHASG